jgi:putative membrane protein
MTLLADAWGMHGGYGAGWMVVMMIGMVIFWAVLLVAVVWLVRGGSGTSGQKQETALEVLDRRYAEGQMSAEEYRERRSVLTGSESSSRS